MNAPTEATRWGRAEGLGLVVVAVLCVAFQAWLPSTHVAEADYQAMGRVLATEAQPGDVVLLAPWWTERGRIYVPDRVPVVGFQGSDGEDLPTHPRIWVLAEPDLPRAGLSAFMRAFGPGRTEVGQERRFGHLSLRLFTNGRSKPVVFDGNELLSRSQVYLEGPEGARQACAWNGNGMQCPNGHTVAVEWHEVHFEPLHCLNLDAPGGATKVVVELPAVEGVDRVWVRAGYVWERQAYRDGVTSSDVGLEVDGQVSVLNLPAGVEGPAFSLDRPGGSRVRLWLSSPNPNARQVCLTVVGFGRAP